MIKSSASFVFLARSQERPFIGEVSESLDIKKILGLTVPMFSILFLVVQYATSPEVITEVNKAKSNPNFSSRLIFFSDLFPEFEIKIIGLLYSESFLIASIAKG